MRIFKTKAFNRWAKKIGIPDTALKVAIKQIADNPKKCAIGGNLYKPRIALDGRGKRGGARTIVACKIKDKAFFLHGYPKNEKDNITEKEKKCLLEAAAILLDKNTEEIARMLSINALTEVKL